MSLDYLSTFQSANHRKPPNLNNNNNTNINTTTNSLKRMKSTSPEYQYKYSKNKHLSQQIHKKKKNRNKQTHHKKKKLLKLKNQNSSNSSNTIHKKKTSKQKKLKLPVINHNNNDLERIDYTKKHNEMNHKHKKIQVINNCDQYYYLQKTSISTNNLNNYNYKKQSKLNTKNDIDIKQKHSENTRTGNIIWMKSPQILKCSPSPMLLPSNNNNNNNNISSPFLLPVPVSKVNKSSHCASICSSPLYESNKGEVLLGFESSNANILFRNLSEMSDLMPQRSNCQISVISDYKYEGLSHHNNPDRIDHDITNCLNILKSINNTRDSFNINKLSLDKLNEMETIIKELKNKIISIDQQKHNDDDDDDDDDDDEQDEEKGNIFINNTDNEQTDSSYLKSRYLSINTNTSDDDDDEEHEDEDEEEEESNLSIITGVQFMENPTPNDSNNGSQEIQYYD